MLSKGAMALVVWDLSIGLFIVGIGIGLLVTGFSYTVDASATGSQGLFAYTGLPLMYTGTFLSAAFLILVINNA